MNVASKIEELKGRIAQQYHKKELLTAEEFSKVPSKINEIINSLNATIDNQKSISDNLSSIQDIVNQQNAKLSNNETAFNELKTDTATKIAELSALVHQNVDEHLLMIDQETGRLKYFADDEKTPVIQSDDVNYTGMNITVTKAMDSFTKYDDKGEVEELSIS